MDDVGEILMPGGSLSGAHAIKTNESIDGRNGVSCGDGGCVVLKVLILYWALQEIVANKTLLFLKTVLQLII